MSIFSTCISIRKLKNWKINEIFLIKKKKCLATVYINEYIDAMNYQHYDYILFHGFENFERLHKISGWLIGWCLIPNLAVFSCIMACIK